MDQLPAWLEVLGGGLVVTAELAAMGIVIAVVLATLLAICAMSPVRPLRALAIGYVELFRSIPLLALLIFVYYGLGPVLSKMGVSSLWLAAAALGVSEAAYLSEIYRGGLRAIPRSQWEAASSIGLGWLATMRLIVLPQAVGPALPSTLNMLIALIKDSSLASLIAVNEVTLRATILVSNTFEPLQVYLVLGAMYLAIIIPLTVLTSVLGRAYRSDAEQRSSRGPALGWLRRAASGVVVPR